MAIKKNKIELRDLSLSLESEMVAYWNDDPYWDWDDDCNGCTYRYCSPWLYTKEEYDYLWKNQPVLVITRRGRVPRLESINLDHGE